MLLPALVVGLLLIASRTVAASEGRAPSGAPPSSKPPPPPKTPSVSNVATTQRAAAEAFIAYVVEKGGRAKPDIKKLQSAMGGIDADGIIGPKTRDRAEKLVGHQIVWPVDVYDPLKEMLGKGSSPASAPAASAPPTKVKSTSKPTKKPPASPAKQKASAALPAQSATDAAVAAQDLFAYVKSGGRERDVVAGFQRRIAVDPDGIVGPGTKARVEQLLGGSQDWPRDASAAKGSAPAPSEPAQAAAELDRYLKSGGKNKDRVRAYQKSMGGIAADGVAGPKTRARIAELLGG